MKYLSHIANQVDDWVRVEAEISGKYSHQWTDAVTECRSDVDFKNLILSSILDRYMFFYVKSRKPHKITRLMLELMNDKQFTFSSPSPRDNSLKASIDHLIKGSGLFPTIYKIQAIWGDEGVAEFIEYLLSNYENFVPNDDHLVWIRKHHGANRLDGKPWNT